MLALAGGMWPQLQTLGLGENKLGANHIAVLEKASFAGLTRLELHGNTLDAAAMKHLIACKLPCLQALRLDNNHLDNSAMVHLAQGDWPRLARLCLNNNFIDAAGINELMTGDWVHLQHLQVDKTAAPLKPLYREWVDDELGVSQSHAISPIRFGSKSCKGRYLIGVTKHEMVWYERVQGEPYVQCKYSDACIIALIFLVAVPLACIFSCIMCMSWDFVRFMKACIVKCVCSILACTFLCTWNLIRFVKECIVKCVRLIKLVFVAWAGLVINCIK